MRGAPGTKYILYTYARTCVGGLGGAVIVVSFQWGQCWCYFCCLLSLSACVYSVHENSTACVLLTNSPTTLIVHPFQCVAHICFSSHALFLASCFCVVTHTISHILYTIVPTHIARSCVNNLVVCVARGAIRMAEEEVVNFQLMKDMPLVHQSLRDTLVEVQCA